MTIRCAARVNLLIYGRGNAMETRRKTTRVAVIDGCRTPFLRSGTGYYDLMAWELGRWAVKGLIAKTGVDQDAIDHVIMGTVASDIATTNVAREIMLGAGLPNSIPAHTCTVACISANAAITSGYEMICSGNADAVIAGGTESFSDPDIKISKKFRRLILDMTMYRRPKSLTGKLRLFKGMRPADFIIPESPALGEYATRLTMGQTADRLAKRLGISREDQDSYAALSHQRAVDAATAGKLKNEIVPVVAPGANAIVSDNGPRSDAKYDTLLRLRPAFYKKHGTVTAGNSSFLTDGASAVLLMNEDKAKALGLKPKAYIHTYAYTAQDPWEELLLGPAFAIAGLLRKVGLELSEIGVFEIHEAFSAQMLANLRCLDSNEFCAARLGLPSKIGQIEMLRLNVYGGSLSLGHPFGATGGRLLTTCINRLNETKEQFGIIAGCAAGAVGNAILLENAA